MRKTFNMGNDEPEQRSFLLPSEGEHFLEVAEFLPSEDENIIIVKCEVIDGLEAGRSLIQRVSLNSEWKGFFTTRLFLKAIGEPYKGKIDIDTDRISIWLGRRFYAFVIHAKSEKNGKTYANIDSYNFDKKIEQYKPPVKETIKEEDIVWGEDQKPKDPSEIKFQD